MANPTITFVADSAGLTFNNPSLFDLRITASTDPTDYALGRVDGWCIDISTDLPVRATYTGVIYSSYEYNILIANPHFTTLGDAHAPVLPSVPTDPTYVGHPYIGNLDLVNWLINNIQVSGSTYIAHVEMSNAANQFQDIVVPYYTLTGHPGELFTYGDVQQAMYELLGDGLLTNSNYLGPYSISNVTSIVNEAVTHDGFVPLAGQKLAVVIDAGTNQAGTIDRQPVIITTQAAALGDYVWNDANHNGIQDAGETGINGATVNLVRDLNNDHTIEANEILATTTTADNPHVAGQHGYYEFDGLTPGLDYQVQFVTPAGYDTVSPRQADANAGSGVNSDALLSNVVDLAPGQFNNTIDAGFYQSGTQPAPAALGDFVWSDTNANGIQDAGEAGIANVTVNLLDSTGTTVLGTTTTDVNGLYHFTNLTPGSYEVQFVAPAGYTVSPQDQGANDAVDSDADTSTGKTAAVTLVSGQIDNTIDAGLYQKAALGDFVWNDTNANGIQDAGEAGIANVTVNLLDSTGTTVLGTTTTDVNGLYHFTNLNPGSYEVQFVAPAGYTVSPQDQGANDAVDSDADTVTGKTAAVTLVSGQIDNTIDAGLYQKAALGDFVWNDTNANGIQDAGEAGIANVTVNLLDSTGTTVLGTTTTDVNGLYHFTGLTPGSYEVQFVAPAGYTVSPQNQGANDAVDSDADTSTGKTAAVTLVSGQIDNTIDAGLYQKAALGDFVWNDTNANGIQDAGETGIANVTVNLLDSTGTTVLGTTTTDVNGLYHFTNLNPGSYEVQFVAPAGYTVSPQDQGANDAVDSDADTVTGKTAAVTLVSGQIDNTIDAGLYQKAALGDFVWNDTNANGIQDAGEAGIANVTVNLLDSTGTTVLGTTTTDVNGLYHFTNLTPGSYEVQFVAPAGYTVSPQDQGANDAVDSDADTSTGKTAAVTLVSGQIDNTIDAGLYQKAALGDFVWNDTNANGIQDAGEAGIANVTVNLLDSTGTTVLGTTTTDVNGLYHFTGLTPGSYEVQFVAPAGYTVSPQNQGANDAVDSDADTSTGKTAAVTLVSGQIDNTIDAGLYQKAALGDFVWNDTNANGIQDAGEAGIANVTVNLLDSTGTTVLGTTTTDVNGLYHFTNLTPGSYEVQFVAPAGYTVSPQDQGANDAVDSDADTSTGKTAAVTLVSGQIDNTIDAGLYQKAALGDFVWNDTNANGIQDAGEAGIANVTVNLLDSTGTTVLGTTTTDVNGLYHFTGLTPGSYEVQFVAPAGYTISAKDQGANDAVDSDADASTGKTIAYTLTSGQINNTVDAGLYQKAALGDFVWNDTNANGIQDAGEAGIANVTVNLLDSTGTTVLGTTTTDVNGLYHFTGLTPGSYEVQFVAPAGYTVSPQNQGANDAVDSDADTSTGKTAAVTLVSGQIDNTVDAGLYQKAALGDFVWNDTNANGIQDAGEAGIANVTVNLLDSTGTTVLGTTTTDVNGLYHFTGLTPGSYEVQFVAPAGYTVSPQNQGANDAVDSDADTSTGKTAAVTLVSGQIDNTIDAGLYQKAALGDFVWNDTNANGIQDAGEAGIANVAVNLLDSTGTTVLGTTTTDVNGLYHFTNLTPGSYEVQFVAPAGYTVSPQDQGANDAVDSDADTLTGKTIAYTLTSGQTNNTVDAGLHQAPPVAAINIEKLVHAEYTVKDGLGTEGLTPGFWKNHSQYGPAPLSGWPETGYSPDASYNAIFGVNIAGNPSLLDALGQNGGGVNALMRHSASALLNAADPYVDFLYTVDQVIAMTQAAINSGNAALIDSTQTLFANQNQLEADLSTPAHTTTIDTPDVDADTGPGPTLLLGETAVFTYVVTNPGAAPLANITVTDDRIPAASIHFVGGDTNHNNLLDPNETWTYTASEIVQTTGQHVNVGTVTGVATGGQVTDNDPAYYTAAANTYSTNSSTVFLGSIYDNLTYTGAGAFSGSGNAKDNVITGGIGNDTLDGVTGADTLIGGLGNDTYIVDNAGDKVVENPGEGTDTVKTSLGSYTLPANVENLIYTGSGAFAGTGNGGDNSITGGAGNDTLDGGAGNDSMAGGLGNDTYIVGSASDIVTEASGAGTDTVLTTLANYTLGSNIENLTFTGLGNFTGTGNTLANLITGGTGNDSLDGGTGADTMTGGTGNDTYFVDNAGDVVNENAGEGTDTVKTTLSSYTLGNNLENLIYTGATAISATGNTLANVLTGGAGADTLTGGGGADSLTGGAGADHFVFSSADLATVDEIVDFSHAAGDKIDLSAIDANPTVNKDQAFSFLGTGAFTHVIGQLHYTISGGAMLVQGDLNGDAIADFTIKVDGTGGLVSTDFVL